MRSVDSIVGVHYTGAEELEVPVQRSYHVMASTTVPGYEAAPPSRVLSTPRLLTSFSSLSLYLQILSRFTKYSIHPRRRVNQKEGMGPRSRDALRKQIKPFLHRPSVYIIKARFRPVLHVKALRDVVMCWDHNIVPQGGGLRPQGLSSVVLRERQATD